MARDPSTFSADALCAAVAEACALLPEVRCAYVFGSQLRGTARPDSDLDVAIDVGHTLSAQQRGRVKLRLIAALTDRLGPLGERADIVELRHAAAAVAFRVIREGRLVKETAPIERIRLEARLARAYDDDAPRRALFLRAAVRVAKQMGQEAKLGRR